MAPPHDRRNRQRVALHWPVHLSRTASAPMVESTTDNLSSEGFYCIANEPFQVGERLQCEIIIPAGTFGHTETTVRLQCHVTVRRVDDLDTSFGFGCHIEDYVLRPNMPLTTAK